MKVCIMTPRFPFPENGGDVLRINAIARYLKNKGHNLILCSLVEKNIEKSNLEEAYKLYDVITVVQRRKSISIFNTIRYFFMGKPMQCGYYYSHKYLKEIRSLAENNQIDLYIPHLLRMIPYIEKLQVQSKTIVEMTDALSKTYGLASGSKNFSIKKEIYKIEKKLIKNYEQRIIKSYKKIVLVSKADISYLGDSTKLFCFTNGINCIENDFITNKNKICFVGNMRTLQNQDAVLNFLNYIFPKIKEKNREAEFHIVGAEPPKTIQNYANGKDIFVTGFVDSVEDYIKDSVLVAAPITIAAGIQNKVLIAMGCNLPVVLTPLISKAIPELISGENCFIEEDFSLFADRCIQLMENSDLRKKISLSGFELMKSKYSWDAVLSGYEELK